MKQKIVIKVQMRGEKCRAKVMKIVAEAYGVTSMAIEGPDKDRVVVIGIGIDSVNLTNSLRKKMGYATIVSVQQTKDNAKDKEGLCSSASSSCCNAYSQYCLNPYPHPINYYGVVCDKYPTNNCSIL